MYVVRSRLRPRSKIRFVCLEEEEGCRMRKQREGTVVRFWGSASVMKRLSGRVRDPPSRAEIVTYVWFSAGGGSDGFEAVLPFW